MKESSGRLPVGRSAMLLAFVCLLICAAELLFGGTPSAQRRWTFSEASPDPVGLRETTPRAGAWRVVDDPLATGARSLVNRAGEPDAPAATLIVDGVRARDVRASTRCRFAATASACGIVFRHTSEAEHHVVRVEGGSVVLGRVAGGREHLLGSTPATIAPPEIWHVLTVEARGDSIHVSWNGRAVIDVHDIALSPAGSVGLWAPARSESFFDDLSVEVFPASAQTLEVLPLFHRRSS